MHRIIRLWHALVGHDWHTDYQALGVNAYLQPLPDVLHQRCHCGASREIVLAP